MKVSKKQLRQIIREQRARLSEYGDYNRDALQGKWPKDAAALKHTIFTSSALYDLIANEVEDYIDNYGDPEGERRGGQYTLTKEEAKKMETALDDAVKAIISEFVLS